MIGTLVSLLSEYAPNIASAVGGAILGWFSRKKMEKKIEITGEDIKRVIVEKTLETIVNNDEQFSKLKAEIREYFERKGVKISEKDVDGITRNVVKRVYTAFFEFTLEKYTEIKEGFGILLGKIEEINSEIRKQYKNLENLKRSGILNEEEFRDKIGKLMAYAGELLKKQEDEILSSLKGYFNGLKNIIERNQEEVLNYIEKRFGKLEDLLMSVYDSLKKDHEEIKGKLDDIDNRLKTIEGVLSERFRELTEYLKKTGAATAIVALLQSEKGKEILANALRKDEQKIGITDPSELEAIEELLGEINSKIPEAYKILDKYMKEARKFLIEVSPLQRSIEYSKVVEIIDKMINGTKNKSLKAVLLRIKEGMEKFRRKIPNIISEYLKRVKMVEKVDVKEIIKYEIFQQVGKQNELKSNIYIGIRAKVKYIYRNEENVKMIGIFAIPLIEREFLINIDDRIEEWSDYGVWYGFGIFPDSFYWTWNRLKEYLNRFQKEEKRIDDHYKVSFYKVSTEGMVKDTTGLLPTILAGIIALAYERLRDIQ